MSATLEVTSPAPSKSKKNVKRALSPDIYKGIFTPQKSEIVGTQTGAKQNSRNLSVS